MLIFHVENALCMSTTRQTSFLWIKVKMPLPTLSGDIKVNEAEVESLKTSLALKTSSRTNFEVLGLGLEASSPRKLPCPRLEDSTIF